MADKFFLDVRTPDNAQKMQPLFDAINGEDPLPCALICAAYIDKCLLGILETIFVKGQTSEQLLKSDTGLLGSLYTRAKIVYLMGHIDSHLFANIGHICTIRNHFAHTHEPLTFESKTIVDLCDKLRERTPNVVVGDPAATEHFEREFSTNRRFRFTTVAMKVVIELMDASYPISKKIAQQP